MPNPETLHWLQWALQRAGVLAPGAGPRVVRAGRVAQPFGTDVRRWVLLLAHTVGWRPSKRQSFPGDDVLYVCMCAFRRWCAACERHQVLDRDYARCRTPPQSPVVTGIDCVGSPGRLHGAGRAYAQRTRRRAAATIASGAKLATETLQASDKGSSASSVRPPVPAVG